MSLATALAPDLDTLARTTDNLLGLLAPMSLEQVNRIPTGFNNNLVWNAAHTFVTQVLLTEGLGGLGVGDLDTGYVATYRKGGAPDGAVSAAAYAAIQEDLAGGVARLRSVLAEADWSKFRVYETSYGKTLRDVGEAVRFSNVHAGMHYGVMLAQRRLV